MNADVRRIVVQVEETHREADRPVSPPSRKAVAAAVIGNAIIPSTKKVGGPGAGIVVAITNKDDIWSFDEMDAAELALPDAPRADEVVVCLALAVGGRPLHRVTRPS